MLHHTATDYCKALAYEHAQQLVRVTGTLAAAVCLELPQ